MSLRTILIIGWTAQFGIIGLIFYVLWHFISKYW